MCRPRFAASKSFAFEALRHSESAYYGADLKISQPIRRSELIVDCRCTIADRPAPPQALGPTHALPAASAAGQAGPKRAHSSQALGPAHPLPAA